MNRLPFLDAITETPLPLDPSQGAAAVERWQAALKASLDGGAESRLAAVLEHEGGRRLAHGLFGASPFLTAVAVQQPLFCLRAFEEGPDALWTETGEPIAESAMDETAAKRALRLARKRASFVIALADVTGIWPLRKVTEALSETADQCIRYALDFAIRRSAERGILDLDGKADPAADCGYFLLGMGKLGSRELNYSSDVDLIALYDPDQVQTKRPDRLSQDMNRLTQAWVDLLQDRTVDGLAFRTDLRLRPDPASTPPAVSVPAAEVYYESAGQNWERAAMIKARVVAGDSEAGGEFLDFLHPFVWRRSLDFWTIRDIHSIKRQINAHHGGTAITVAGHDIKVGRGGIREIEFFAQTQQLIWGGREPSLRIRSTCDALSALVACGRVDRETAEKLQQCYIHLRRLEHRLQMVADQQTQRLPPANEMDGFARFMGEGDTRAFVARVRETLETVERYYAELFEEEPALTVEGLGNLVFTGSEPDPGTLETLSELGFHVPERVDAAVRGWHHGRIAATRTSRSRALLTELMPTLLRALGNTADPDEAFSNFDHFLHGLPAGVQLFSLFQTHPDLLDLVAEICGSAPLLGQHMRRRPAVLDAVLTRDFLGPLPSTDEQKTGLQTLLSEARDFQDSLDLARRFASDLSFRVGVHLLFHQTAAADTRTVLSVLADNTVAAMQGLVSDAFAERHGRVPGNGLAVVSYGKWGSCQMTPGSDLDMVALYDSQGVTSESDGMKALPASTYFARLTQRLVTALSSETESGRLFQVDLRLRPSGDKGPLASHIDGFESYQLTEAWTWEHLALVRARMVAGTAEMVSRFEAVRAAALGKSRDPASLADEVDSMRQRMARTYKGESPWDAKYRRGGLVDTGFISQFLVLAHASREPALLVPRATDQVAATTAASGIIGDDEAEALAEAEAFWLDLQSLLRLTGADATPGRLARPATQSVIAQGLGLPDLSRVEATASEHADRVMKLYAKLIAA
jgi:[glutamine synthetase] adenylyltransferase / [glutamine synthetase]-adenylyl-L-tyrosine phosphorylase